MNVIKERLENIRIEENELQDTITGLQKKISTVKNEKEYLQCEMQDLGNREKLLNHKLRTKRTLLENVLSQLTQQEGISSSSNKVLESLSVKSENRICIYEKLKTEFDAKSAELRCLQSELENVSLRFQHVVEGRRQKNELADAKEKKVEKLEKQLIELTCIRPKTESVEIQESVNDDLELKLKEMQKKLETINDDVAESHREMVRLDRLIKSHQGELDKLVNENKKLESELEDIVSEITTM